jgi:two-component system, NtrC family, sensor histidine kinase HydH
LVSVTPIKGSDKFIIVHRDITEFKNLEKKFYESQQLAALGQLSAGIAHEVRNPLSSIKMSLQILERRMKPEGNDLKRFQIAQTEVEHLERLVNDILIYAKPEGLHRREFDFNTFIEHSLEMAEKEVTQKAIIVKLNLDPAIGTASLDSAKLNQALLNLYLNAIDAMEEGGHLDVSARRLDGPNGRIIEIAVQDNGCGIGEKDLAYIFNPFFTKKSYGTGLGLTQVKKIIDLHQGAIDIFSAEGKGTRVVITLPAPPLAGS